MMTRACSMSFRERAHCKQGIPRLLGCICRIFCCYRCCCYRCCCCCCCYFVSVKYPVLRLPHVAALFPVPEHVTHWFPLCEKTLHCWKLSRRVVRCCTLVADPVHCRVGEGLGYQGGPGQRRRGVEAGVAHPCGVGTRRSQCPLAVEEGRECPGSRTLVTSACWGWTPSPFAAARSGKRRKRLIEIMIVMSSFSVDHFWVSHEIGQLRKVQGLFRARFNVIWALF